MKKKPQLKPNSKEYFRQEHQDAVIKYKYSTDSKERNDIYNNILREAILELLDKIVCTFKFNTLPNVEMLKKECEEHIASVLDKYDENKGYKAFSYLSIVSKNWFIAKTRKNSYKKKLEVTHEDISKAVEMEFLSHENPYFELVNKQQFFEALMKEIEEWGAYAVRPNEKKVLEAIKLLMSVDHDNMIMNRKAIYKDIHEITNLTPKQISNNLKKFRKYYSQFKKKWFNELT